MVIFISPNAFLSINKPVVLSNPPLIGNVLMIRLGETLVDFFWLCRHSYIYIYIRGVRVVTVIVKGNGLCDSEFKSWKSHLFRTSHGANTMGKRMDPPICPTTSGWIIEKTGLFSLSKETNQGERKGIKTCFLLGLNNGPMSHPACADELVYIYIYMYADHAANKQRETLFTVAHFLKKSLVMNPFMTVRMTFVNDRCARNLSLIGECVFSLDGQPFRFLL